MADRTTSSAHQDTFITQMTAQMGKLAHQLSSWVTAAPHPLAEVEQMTLRVSKELGQTLLTGLCQLRLPCVPAPDLPCPCGGAATYQRQRPLQVQTLLGPLSLSRPYYLCAQCHHGFAPLDHELGMAAGCPSAGLTELLALLGAQFTFQDAVGLVEKLTLVTVCPNAVRDATERVGATIAMDEQQAMTIAWDPTVATLPPPPPQAPARLYISMDGKLVHTHSGGWRELKLGACYTTRQVRPQSHPERLEVRAEQFSFVADITDPETFGRLLWLEAHRRGVQQVQEVVAIGDGAHWIWNLVEEQFPEAVQIVDWYHATEYIWNAAHAVYGETNDLAKPWAQARLDELWAGQVTTVVGCLQAHAGKAAVDAAISYYTNNAARMRYPEYRARGLQIGSGSIESGCNHVVGARLTQAGMIWNVEGARAVAKLRARLKSGRWAETMEQRPPPHRTYQRHRAA